MTSLVIRVAQLDDLSAIRQIIEEWQRDPHNSLRQIEDSIRGNEERKFFIAEDNSKLVGVMGLTTFGIDKELIGGRPVAELISAYVSRSVRGQGVGWALADKIESVASKIGVEVLLIVSGSRNREYGYPFWNKRYGQPIRIDKDYFAPGEERMIWLKELDKK